LGVIVVKCLLPVLRVIVTGYSFRKSGVVSKEHWLGVDLLAYWLLIPSLVFVSLVKMDLRNMEVG
jgi:malonate transporter